MLFFSKQPARDGQIGYLFFQCAHAALKTLHFATDGRTSRVAGQMALASLQKFLRPYVTQALVINLRLEPRQLANRATRFRLQVSP
jgi:hypothetical protein